MTGRRRLLAALALVAVGRLLSPAAVPVYDGIGQPDEPYRYVVAPPGAKLTGAPTAARVTSPVVSGVSSYGLSVTTQEVGPQFSLFLPPRALATTGSTVVVTATPEAPTDQPADARIDGNVYVVALSGGGPVTLTAQAALATLYLRSTTTQQPPPVMEHRARPADPWVALKTTRGGQDVYVAGFPGPGEFALAFERAAPAHHSRTPYLVVGGLLLLVAVVVVIRIRAAE